MPRVRTLELSRDQRTALEWVRDHDEKPYMRERAAALLKVAGGMSGVAVASHGLLRVRSEEAVYRWLDRYAAEGIDGLRVRKGRGRKPGFSPSKRRGAANDA